MWRYARFRRSGATRGSSFESYVPSASMIRRSPSSAVPSPRRNSLALLKDLLQEEFTGAIRRAHERSRGDVGEAHRFAGHAELFELLRGHVFLDGEVPVARAKVLADGHDVHRARAEVSHRCEHFRSRLAESEHDRGLREQTRSHLFRASQDLQALRVACASVPDRALQPLDRLDIVIEDVDARIDDRSDGIKVAL